MADKEHRAAKAGRYVRAAGIVLGKEIDRRAQATAAKAIPVAPPPPPPPPPPAPTSDFFGRTTFVTFVAALVSLVLVLVHAADSLPGTTKTVVQLVLAFALLLEAALLASNWERANERTGQRLLTRVWGPRGADNRRERTFARIVRDVLTLIGIVFLAAGVYSVLTIFVAVDG